MVEQGSCQKSPLLTTPRLGHKFVHQSLFQVILHHYEVTLYRIPILGRVLNEIVIIAVLFLFWAINYYTGYT